MPADRHAVLIGINRYPSVDSADLKGCLNDVELVASLLCERFGFPPEGMHVLQDGEATRAGILSVFAELADRVGRDDVVVLFFAGHGSRTRDPREPSRFRESIVPHDSGRVTHPNRDILDYEIDAWVQRLNQTMSHVCLILDCCHSGGRPAARSARRCGRWRDRREPESLPGASPRGGGASLTLPAPG